MELVTENPSKRPDNHESLQIIQVERERERETSDGLVRAVGQLRLNKYGLEAQWWLDMTAEENFEYWISNC